MSTSTNQKPMWQVSFGPAPGRCHAATSTLTILDTSAPLRKCTRPRPWPHSAVAARPLSARATATCDTLLRVTPFRGAPRASACLPSSGRPLLRHPAPPRPSVKRATSPLPPVDRPPFPFLTSLPPPLRLPSFQIIMCAREDVLSAWRASNWPGDPRERSIRARHQRRHRRRHQARLARVESGVLHLQVEVGHVGLRADDGDARPLRHGRGPEARW